MAKRQVFLQPDKWAEQLTVVKGIRAQFTLASGEVYNGDVENVSADMVKVNLPQRGQKLFSFAEIESICIDVRSAY
jgi:hypothetical protein